MKKFGLSQNALERLWVNHKLWPNTVWNISDNQTAISKYKEIIGDMGQARAGCDRNIGYKKWFGKSENNVSIFNPGIIAMIMGLYGDEIPPGGNIYDPFGGGGTRALVCASNGFNYVGVEIREEEVQALRTRLGDFNLPGTARIIHGDARKAWVTDNWADAVITCPPYYNLEPYNGGPNDISMCDTYDPEFLNAIEDVICDCRRILKPGGLAFWVVGLHRDEKTKELLAINHDLSNIHREHGYHFREEVILYRKQTSAASRLGMFDKGNRLLIRNHEYLLIYRNDKEE